MMTAQDATEHKKQAGRRLGSFGSLVVVLVTVALSVTACDGSTSPGVASVSSRSTTTSPGESTGPRYATCMRAHGVANFPDAAVSVNGDHVQFDLPHGVKTEPNFASASRACAKDLPGAGIVPAKHDNIQDELAFARCMRSHGITDFPDPLPGGGWDLPGNTNSPQFETAARVCQSTGIHWNGP